MVSTNDLSGDLNTVIAGAVNARVEAAVIAALSGDDVIGRYVTAALQQEVSATNDSYDRKKTTFLNRVVADSIREAAKRAVGVALREEQEQINKLVRAAVKKQLVPMADAMAAKLLASADSPYGVTVELKWPG